MTLHPQAVAFLDAVAAQGRPGWNEMPPEQGRDLFAGLTDLFGEGEDLQRVENVNTESGVRMRIYQSDPLAQPPAVMYFHGGGWVLGDIDTHDTLCRHLAAASDCAVVAVDYRRAPEHPYPAAFDDCYAATQFIAEHSGELRLNARSLIVAGDSAGGNLAAAVALKARDTHGPSIQAQLLIYPVIEKEFDRGSYTQFAEDFGLSREVMIWFWDQYLGAQQADPYAVPSLADSHRGLPPAHVVTAEYDVLRDEGEAFAARLRGAGVETSLRRYEGMLHGFVHCSAVFDVGMEAIADIADMLRSFASRTRC